VAVAVTHRFPFEQALDAYEMILAGKEPYIGVVLEYGEREPARLYWWAFPMRASLNWYPPSPRQPPR
jgi:hypothetical protein